MLRIQNSYQNPEFDEPSGQAIQQISVRHLARNPGFVLFTCSRWFKRVYWRPCQLADQILASWAEVSASFLYLVNFSASRIHDATTTATPSFIFGGLVPLALALFGLARPPGAMVHGDRVGQNRDLRLLFR